MTTIKRFLLNFLGRFIASDHFARRFPISIKGVVFYQNKVLLLQNERGEWDLPGGKLSAKESIADCLKREFREETQIQIDVHELLSTWKVTVLNQVEVVLVAYRCELLGNPDAIKISFEHNDVGFFGMNELKDLPIKPSIVDAIQKGAILVRK